jgi:hypothetical protein
VVFLVVGIGFKFGAAPFHMWLPDVYQGAPTAITLFIGSAPKLAAFGMAYRLLEWPGALDGHWREMLAWLAVAVAERSATSSPSRRPTSSACWPIRRSRTSASCSWAWRTARRRVTPPRCSTRSAMR